MLLPILFLLLHFCRAEWGTEFVFSFLKCRDFQFPSNLTIAVSNSDPLYAVQFDLWGRHDFEPIHAIVPPRTITEVQVNGSIYQVQQDFAFGKPSTIVGFSSMEDKGFRVRANATVQVYLDCRGFGTPGPTSYIYQEDSTAVLPIELLGSHYFAVAPRIVAWWPRQFVITTVETDTKVTVRVPGFEPYRFQFDRPLSTLAFSTMDDHSGTEITATRPVAFSSGQVDVVPIQAQQTTNHVGEMMLPTTLWGTSFPLSPLYRSPDDAVDYRIVAACNNTLIYWKQRVACRLHTGQNCLLRLQQGILYSSKLVHVVMFGQATLVESGTDESIGTAFMSQVSARQHYIRDTMVQYQTFGDGQNSRTEPVRHFVQLTTNHSSCLDANADIRVDDRGLDEAIWSSFFDEYRQLVSYLFETANGTHRISNRNQCLFSVSVYGYAQTYSYSYNAIMGRQTVNRTPRNNVCRNEPVATANDTERLNSTNTDDPTIKDCRDAKLDLIVMLDSGKVENATNVVENYNNLTDFAFRFIKHILKLNASVTITKSTEQPDGTQVGVSSMKKQSNQRKELGFLTEAEFVSWNRMLRNEELLYDKISALVGVEDGMTQFYYPTNRPDAPDVLLVLLAATDGSSPRSVQKEAIGSGRSIIVVAMGDSTTNLDHLSQISYSNPNRTRRMYLHEGFDHLEELIEPLCKNLPPLGVSDFELRQTKRMISDYFLSAVFTLNTKTALTFELVRFWLKVIDESPGSATEDSDNGKLLGWAVSQEAIHYRAFESLQVDFYQFCVGDNNPPLPESMVSYGSKCKWQPLSLPPFRYLRFELHLGFNDALYNFDKYPLNGAVLTIETPQAAPPPPQLVGLRTTGNELVILTWRLNSCSCLLTNISILITQVYGDFKISYTYPVQDLDCRLQPVQVNYFSTEDLPNGSNYTVQVMLGSAYGNSERSNEIEFEVPSQFPWAIVIIVFTTVLLVTMAVAAAYAYKIKRQKRLALKHKDDELLDERIQKDIFRELYKGVARVANYVGRPLPCVPGETPTGTSFEPTPLDTATVMTPAVGFPKPEIEIASDGDTGLGHSRRSSSSDTVYQRDASTSGHYMEWTFPDSNTTTNTTNAEIYVIDVSVAVPTAESRVVHQPGAKN